MRVRLRQKNDVLDNRTTVTFKLICSDDEPSGNPQVTRDQESPDEEDMVVVYKVPSDSEPEPEPPKNLQKSRKPPQSSEEESDDDGYKHIDVMYVQIPIVFVYLSSCIHDNSNMKWF